jgi:hypothetical protein
MRLDRSILSLASDTTTLPFPNLVDGLNITLGVGVEVIVTHNPFSDTERTTVILILD